MKRRFLALGPAVVFTVLTAGCGPEPVTPHTTILIGATATANEPAVDMHDDNLDVVRDAVGRGTVDVLGFVGSATDQPVVRQDVSVYYDERTKELETDSERLDTGYQKHMTPVREKMAASAGTQSQLDLLGLLGEMAHTNGPATMLVYSSGLQTTGLLDLRGWGSDLDVDATVEGLPEDKLPDLTDKHVFFVGLGQVAGPQQQLPPEMYSAVQELWLKVCRKAHGHCEPLVQRSSGGPPLSTVPVPVIPVPSHPTVTVFGDPATGQTVRILLPNGVFFRKESADFLPGADQALRGMTQYFRSDAASVARSATAVGHTATSGPRDGAVELSKKRACRVVDALAADGIDRSLFKVDGVGFDRPLSPDLDSAGRLIPEAAEKNRTVEVTVTRFRSTR
ncbi:OmpA family protein [Amycolatopsis sp. NPDC098790]|uniref:OmpA family protein n=1 Tax=Amycolatopsis sp. NPDC098790 TaxID=3363939 RepID=UPI00381699AD